MFSAHLSMCSRTRFVQRFLIRLFKKVFYFHFFLLASNYFFFFCMFLLFVYTSRNFSLLPLLFSLLLSKGVTTHETKEKKEPDWCKIRCFLIDWSTLNTLFYPFQPLFPQNGYFLKNRNISVYRKNRYPTKTLLSFSWKPCAPSKIFIDYPSSSNLWLIRNDFPELEVIIVWISMSHLKMAFFSRGTSFVLR